MDHVPAASLPRIQDKNFVSSSQASSADFLYPVQTMLIMINWRWCVQLTLAFCFFAVFQLLRQISFSTDKSCKYNRLRYPYAINSLKNAPQFFWGVNNLTREAKSSDRKKRNFTITERILVRWLVESYGLLEYRPWEWCNMSRSAGCFVFVLFVKK